MKVLTTIKSLTELDIDLIDSNEAMLILNNLPNVQILNGRSTKDDDDDDEEEDNAGEGGYEENKNNKNIHLSSHMEEIEEKDKNLENNSNYISEKKDNNEKNEKNLFTFSIKNMQNENENEKTKGNNKDKKMTRNMNVLNEKELNPKIDSNGDGLFQPSPILNDKNELNNEKIDINETNKNNNDKKSKKEKEKDSIYDFDNVIINNTYKTNTNNVKKNKYLIDLTNEELNLLKGKKYDEKSNFTSLTKDFYDLINNEDSTSDDGTMIQNNYISKLKIIEGKKKDISNYYYFFLLYKKKIKMIQNMYKDIFPYILKKCPELNKDNAISRLNNELFKTIKDSKELINLLCSHIEGYTEKKNNSNNLNDLIQEKDKKITSLEKIRDKLILDMKEDKGTYEKKISNLEKENKIMTDRILSKVDILLNPNVKETETSIPTTDRFPTKISHSINSGLRANSQNKKYVFNYNELLNTNFVNHYCPTSKTRSPYKYTENNTNTLDYNNTTINNYLNTNSNVNNNKPQLISLKSLKDFINELYISKAQYDIKCTEMKIPKETLEEHMYTFLNKKYGLKNLIIEWAKNIISGIKYYSKKDSIVLLFGKIMRNEQEEDARFIVKKVSESIEELLIYYIKRQNPLKLTNEIKRIFDKKKKSELFEEEWKGIIYSIYEKEEANEIEKKIINYISKENEKKKMEMFKKFKNSRLNSKNRKNKNHNNITGNTTYYLNTINSLNNMTNNNPNNINNSFYVNSIGSNCIVNNKLSRVEKYNILLFSDDEKKIYYKDFLKIVLDNHIRFRDKQLKKFVDLFKSVDKNKDGIIDEDEFSELIHRMKIFKEEEVDNIIFQYLDKIDPYDNQKITFSDCITFFSAEIIKDTDINGNEKEVSILEKICFNESKYDNERNETINNNESNEQVIESTITTDNNATIKV